jgi:hypothetical protein
MHVTKIRAFFEEFPWLQQYVSPTKATDIYVRRVDESILGGPQQGQELISCPSYDGDKEVRTVVAKVRILDANGVELMRVGQTLVPSTRHSWYIAWFLPTQSEYEVQRFDETVYDALLRLSSSANKHKGHFMISIIKFSSGEEHVTVYKAPKGTDLVTWLEKAMEERRKEVKNTLLDLG